MKPTIYIAVGGGCVQGVRVAGLPEGADCIVVDYDNLNDGDGTNPHAGQTEEEFERDVLGGHTWAEIEAASTGVW